MARKKARTRVLFLSADDSCTGPMAEGFARLLKNDVVEARSAGLLPRPLHPMTAAVMADAGVDISSRSPTALEDLGSLSFDYVIVLDPAPSRERLSLPPNTKIFPVAFENPADAAGTEEERLEVFRRVCDGIREFVENLPVELEHNQEDE